MYNKQRTKSRVQHVVLNTIVDRYASRMSDAYTTWSSRIQDKLPVESIVSTTILAHSYKLNNNGTEEKKITTQRERDKKKKDSSFFWTQIEMKNSSDLYRGDERG